MLVKIIDTATLLAGEFRAYDRDYYSYEGYQAILDYFSDGWGEDIELDVIAICGDFTEACPEDIASDYGVSVDEILEYLEDNTWFVLLDNGNILYTVF